MMEWVEIICACSVGSWSLLMLYIYATSNRIFDTAETNLENQPFVSILIALRNEEENVESVCASLERLNYPKDKFEIIFGDDDSTDRTLEILKKHVPDNAKIIPISTLSGIGKQNVLSQLSSQSQGEFLLFTDADMTFGEKWIQGMLGIIGDAQVGLGITKVRDENLFAKFQNLDWLINEFFVFWLSCNNIFSTAWGNNMIIEKKAFDNIGGYADLEPSLVEDVSLVKKLINIGGKLKISFVSDALTVTAPSNTFMDILHQRKRWMQGMTGMSPLLYVGLFLKLSFLPSLIFLMTLNSWWSVILILMVCLQALLLSKILSVVKVKDARLMSAVFLIYDFVFYLITFAFYLLPFEIRWKGRSY